jgi:hypothetical protein
MMSDPKSFLLVASQDSGAINFLCGRPNYAKLREWVHGVGAV